MTSYEIFLDNKARSDIQSAYDFYEEKQFGLGDQFLKRLNQAFQALELNPFYQIRYDKVRCYPIQKFPYMLHYRLEESLVVIYGVINTSMNPKEKWIKVN